MKLCSLGVGLIYRASRAQAVPPDLCSGDDVLSVVGGATGQFPFEISSTGHVDLQPFPGVSTQ